MPVVEANGIGISYADAGAGVPVVLIMGTAASGRVWSAHQVPALREAGFRVVTFDNRGTPPTDECPGGFGLADMVADTAALIERLDLGRCHVVGTSLGATVAQELAGTRPELVDRLVLMATRCRPDAMRRELSIAEREMLDSGVRLPVRYQAVLDAIQNLSPRTLADDESVTDWLDVLAATQAPRGKGTRIQMDISDLADHTAVCEAITSKTLVVGFADDVINPPSLCRQVALAVPGSRFEIVADCGHYGYLERPDEVNRLVIGFLQE